jgi:hypothetical protein
MNPTAMDNTRTPKPIPFPPIPPPPLVPDVGFF